MSVAWRPWVREALDDVLWHNRFRKHNFLAGTTRAADLRGAVDALRGAEPWDDGPWIGRFEERFARETQSRHAVSFAAGRMSFYALLGALGVGPGDEVLLPAYNCVVVPNAVLYRGARPRYVDIEPSTYGMDPVDLRKKLSPRTRAIVLQHTFGIPGRAREILEAAGEVPVIEDCAHSLGATLGGGPLGRFGRAAFYSCDATKMISTGLGGVVTTNDDRLAESLRQAQAASPFLPPSWTARVLFGVLLQRVLADPRAYWIGRSLLPVAHKLGLTAYFKDELMDRLPLHPPYPARMGNALARLGFHQLEGLPENLAWRRRQARAYQSFFQELWPGAAVPVPVGRPSYLRFPFLVEDPALWRQRSTRRVEWGDWFSSVTHGRKTRLDLVGYAAGDCPVAEWAAARTLNLPTHFLSPPPARVKDWLAASGQAVLAYPVEAAADGRPDETSP